MVNTHVPGTARQEYRSVNRGQIRLAASNPPMIHSVLICSLDLYHSYDTLLTFDFQSIMQAFHV